MLCPARFSTDVPMTLVTRIAEVCPVAVGMA
jgi:hypothetical protein